MPYKNVYDNAEVNLSQLDTVFVGMGERQNRVRRGDVLITASSETPQDCGMSSVVMSEPENPVYLNSFCFGWRSDSGVSLAAGYLKHLFRAEITRKQIVRTANGVTRFNISKRTFANIVIPVPPLDEQRRIAGILDKFDALTTSLTSGLPAEIGARRKQYAYYRDRLLSFKEKTA